MSGYNNPNAEEDEDYNPTQSFSGQYDNPRGSYFPSSVSQSQPVSSVARYGSRYAVSAAGASPQTYSVASGSHQSYSSLREPVSQVSPSYGSYYQAADSQRQPAFVVGGYPGNYPVPSSGAGTQDYSVASGSHQSYSSLPGLAPQASPSYATVTAGYDSRYQGSHQSGSQSYEAASIDIRQPSESVYAAPTIRPNSVWTRVTPSVREDMMREFVVDTSQGDNVYGDTAQQSTYEEIPYDPYGLNGDRQPVIDLWRNVCDERLVPGGQPLGSRLEICHRFDHVDFYRVIYLTVLFRGTVENTDENFFYHIATILNHLGRPPGYTRTLAARRPGATSNSNHTTAELQALFAVLSDKRCRTRDEPFQRVLQWARTEPNQPYKVLKGIYNSVQWYVAAGHRAGTGLPTRWEWYPYSFMYKQEEDGDPNIWYRDDGSGQGSPSALPAPSQAGSSRQLTKRDRHTGNQSSGSSSRPDKHKKKRH